MLICVQIGNTDNKLTQYEWSHYCHAIKQTVNAASSAIHFAGGSDWDAPWQNACWVFALHPDKSIHELEQELIRIRTSYRQDSIAVMFGEVRML